MTKCESVQCTTDYYSLEACPCECEEMCVLPADDPEVESLIPSSGLPFFLDHYFSSQVVTPMKIDGPVVIVANPMAGNGRGAKTAAELHTQLSRARSSGQVIIDGDIIYHETLANPVKRTEAIVDVVRSFNPKRPPYVISVGGDGTAADVMEAAMKASRDGYRPFVIPGPGGTANDLRRNQGFSSNPTELVFQLPRAEIVELDVVYVSVNGGQPELMMHSQSTGASGDFFTAVNERLASLKSSGQLKPISGPVSYIVKAPGAVLGAEPFQVRVFLDGVEVPIKTTQIGEVITTVNTTSLGGITRFPQPLEGARIHFLPINNNLPGVARYAPGLAPIGEVVANGVRFSLGDQSVVAPGKTIRYLQDYVDIKPGQDLRVEFFDLEGRPTGVRGVLNGDVQPESIRVLEFKATGEKLPTLAMPDSGLMIQRGRATPGTVWQKTSARFSNGFNRYGHYAFFGTIAGYEIYKDATNMSPRQRTYSDLGFLSTLFGMDLYAAARYGTNPLLYEMPLIIPVYEMGNIATGEFVDFVGRVSGYRPLRRGSTAHKVISIGGGYAAAHTTVKVVGPSAWKAAGGTIGRMLGVVGEGVESFFSGAINYIRTTPILTPIIILPGFDDYYEYNHNRIPSA